MDNTEQKTIPDDSNLADTPATTAEPVPDELSGPDLADSAPAPAETGPATPDQTNPEFSTTPETESAAPMENDVPPPNIETSPDNTTTENNGPTEITAEQEDAAASTETEIPDKICPVCPEPKCDEITVDSPKFKELLKIYLSGFVLVRKAKRERNLLIIDPFTAQDKITNDRVQALLKVSDRTAAAYLSALFKQGKIMRFGTGKKTFYQRIP